MGRNGMVCAGHPLAAQAGISVLQKGGNAFDAAIATAAVLNVVEPLMSGIGGDGFIMAYRSEDDRLRVSNGTGAAPYSATLERYRDGIPMKGILSVSVPGLLNAWLDVHSEYGALPLADVLAPAIALADDGFPVTHYLASAIAGDSLLCEFPTSRAIFTRDGSGEPLRAGEILRQGNLARTLSAIAEQGWDVFYRGEIGEAIVRFSDEQGGLLTMADLNDCSARWQDPISTDYGDYTVYEAPPNSSGHILLQELNVIRQHDIASMGFGSAASIHLMVEAKKLAFIDREAYVADPDYIDVPVEGLISREYARDRAELIDPKRSAMNVEPGNPWAYQARQRQGMGAGRRGIAQEHEDTTCFVVVDREGNAVCQLQSLQGAWGSSIIAGDTGILLNNRMTYWHLEEDHVDCLQPGKRVRHTMNPVMVFDGGPSDGNGTPHRLKLILGTPGADTQVQANLQVISHVVDFGMTVAEAVEFPRWKDNQSPTESNIPHVCQDELLMEGRFPAETVKGLEGMGHPVRVLAPWDGVTGREMMIQVDPETGALQGAADPRYDGYAVGW
jgi:gamma-glutamyltranspeptidase/glutathione hydrolase